MYFLRTQWQLSSEAFHVVALCDLSGTMRTKQKDLKKTQVTYSAKPEAKENPQLPIPCKFSQKQLEYPEPVLKLTAM